MQRKRSEFRPNADVSLTTGHEAGASVCPMTTVQTIGVIDVGTMGNDIGLSDLMFSAKSAARVARRRLPLGGAATAQAFLRPANATTRSNYRSVAQTP